MTGRIVARLLEDGRVEFGWQPTGGARVLPRQRYFPADPGHRRWLRSSPIEVDGAEIGRINARWRISGEIEFTFTPTDRTRILPDARYFPADARPNRWLRSTEITFSTGPTLFIAVSAGGGHTCAIRETGEITCWGGGDYDWGESSTINGRYIAVSAGLDHNCAIAESNSRPQPHSIRCWGRSEHGQTDAPEGSYTAVSAGRFRTCAIREDNGAIECWGNRPEDYPVIGSPPEGSFIAISVGGAHRCAIAETFESTNATDTTANTGELECWGNNETGQTDSPKGRFRAVSAAGDYTCAIRESGELECWGHDGFGETDPPDGSYTAVSAGLYHSCAIRESGELDCWGNNTNGETDVPEGSYTAVSAAGDYTCAIRDTGKLACWGGLNESGQATPPTE